MLLAGPPVRLLVTIRNRKMLLNLTVRSTSLGPKRNIVRCRRWADDVMLSSPPGRASLIPGPPHQVHRLSLSLLRDVLRYALLCSAMLCSALKS